MSLNCPCLAPGWDASWTPPHTPIHAERQSSPVRPSPCLSVCLSARPPAPHKCRKQPFRTQQLRLQTQNYRTPLCCFSEASHIVRKSTNIEHHIPKQTATVCNSMQFRTSEFLKTEATSEISEFPSIACLKTTTAPTNPAMYKNTCLKEF